VIADIRSWIASRWPDWPVARPRGAIELLHVNRLGDPHVFDLLVFDSSGPPGVRTTVGTGCRFGSRAVAGLRALAAGAGRKVDDELLDAADLGAPTVVVEEASARYKVLPEVPVRRWARPICPGSCAGSCGSTGVPAEGGLFQIGCLCARSLLRSSRGFRAEAAIARRLFPASARGRSSFDTVLSTVDCRGEGAQPLPRTHHPQRAVSRLIPLVRSGTAH
jgi:hypothetical protein